MPKFSRDKIFSCIFGGDKPLWRELKLYEGRVIFITIMSLFHFFRNSQHPEKWSVSFKNFFRKCECICSCYLPISSNLLEKSLRKTSLFVLFELLPTAFLRYVRGLTSPHRCCIMSFSQLNRISQSGQDVFFILWFLSI